MMFAIEVFVTAQSYPLVKEWRRLRPTNGPPYEWPTEAEADRMLRMCYGPSFGGAIARVVAL